MVDLGLCIGDIGELGRVGDVHFLSVGVDDCRVSYGNNVLLANTHL